MQGNTLRLPTQLYSFNHSWLDVADTMQHLCSNLKDFRMIILNNKVCKCNNYYPSMLSTTHQKKHPQCILQCACIIYMVGNMSKFILFLLQTVWIVFCICMCILEYGSECM